MHSLVEYTDSEEEEKEETHNFFIPQATSTQVSIIMVNENYVKSS